MQIKVYTASEKDLPVLASIERAIFSDAWSDASLASHLSSPFSVSLLLSVDGLPIASLTGSLLPPEGEIYRVAVLPDYRRQGFGARLLSAFLSLADGRGAEELFMEVRESNSPAQALYASFGFTEYARRRGYYADPREDAILMKRNSRKD